MAGEIKKVLLAEGIEVTPTPSSLGGLGTYSKYADDAAYVAAKGSAAADGDTYYQTTIDGVRVYIDGAWVTTSGFADGSNSGLVSTAAQAFAGVKTFNAGINLGQGTVAALLAGTYTVAAVAGTGLNAATGLGSHWIRIGNEVTVTGQVNIDGNGAGIFALTLSLPFTRTSNFSSTTEASGVLSIDDALFQGCRIEAAAGTKKVDVDGYSTHTTSETSGFTFTYTTD